ncbi:unnamed protein product, partial [Adineta ricciae]
MPKGTSRRALSHPINFPTVLEHLPNEILISIFSYFTGIDLVLAFANLNSRFYSLTNQYAYFFDFKSISKTKFDFILAQQQTNRSWKSLQICNNKGETPGQIQYFCKFHSLVDICPQLESLSLLDIQDICKNEDLLVQLLSCTPNLQSLTVKPICATILSQFQLLQLKRLVIHSCRNLVWMIELRQLENLEYTIADVDCTCAAVFAWPLSLKRLQVIFTRHEDLRMLQSSFVHLSQLAVLEIYQNAQIPVSASHTIGEVWQQLISSCFPLLREFRFYFYLRLTSTLKSITQSFSTPFYLFERRWFVRCEKFSEYSTYTSSMDYNAYISLYSLPLLFQPSITMINGFCVTSISSTLPKDLNNDLLYPNQFSNTKNLVLARNPTYLDENFRRNNLTRLTVRDSFASREWMQVLTKLRQLSLTEKAQMSSDSFHYLLDHAPELDTLVIDCNFLQILTDSWTHTGICDHLSKKIRHLKFHSANNARQCFNKHKLSGMLPVFASKCEHLSLSIQSKLDLVILTLKRMKRLHSLHVHMSEKAHLPMTMDWFDEHKTKFNYWSSFLVREDQDYYF